MNSGLGLSGLNDKVTTKLCRLRVLDYKISDCASSPGSVKVRGAMSALDITVIGFGSFILLIAVGLIALLAANRH